MRNLMLISTFLISSMVFAQQWEPNWTAASTKAEKNTQNIILVFSGSDWCGPCIKLDKEIWSTPKFQELSKGVFVMYRADFPRKGKNALAKDQQDQNSRLAEKYNQNGYFPLVVVLDSKAKVLGSLGYEKTTPELYFKKLKTFEK